MQAAQMQQQAQMMQLELTIQKLQAEVQKIQSEAAVNMSKAQDITQIDPQLRVAELQQTMDIKMRELELRRELASLTNQTRQQQSQTTAAAKLATTAMNSAAKTN